MKSQVKIKKKIIKVEWYDHCSLNSWISQDSADSWCAEEPIICITVGWLWYEDLNQLVIAQTITPDQVSELQKIIKKNIIKREILNHEN